MLLAIDCGNTNTVFSIWDGTKFIATWRIATDHKRTADEYFVWLSSLMTLNKIEAQITQAIISSTVPRVVYNLRVLCDRYFDCRPLVVGKPECRLPIAPRVDQGVTVGPDRLVNTVSGFDRHGGDLIVVDFGTATTFDVVDRTAPISAASSRPASTCRLRRLHMAAAALAACRCQPPRQCDRHEYGGLHAVGRVLGLYRPCRRHLPPDPPGARDRPMKVIATGGLAPLFQQGTRIFDAIEDDLTMHGLRPHQRTEYEMKRKPHESEPSNLSSPRRRGRDRDELLMSMAMAPKTKNG